MEDARASIRIVVGGIFALLAPLWLNAALADPAELCEAAARRASQETGVPLRVLRAVALTESGRARGPDLRPWPWTVNVEGEGRWFASRAEALDWIAERRGRGATSIDVGCFQINTRWHGAEFASLSAMIAPEANARYAARLLARHFSERGDWIAAAGAYHSRTERHAARYRERVAAHLEDLPDRPPPPAAVAARGLRPLASGSPAGLGSLVPLGQGG